MITLKQAKAYLNINTTTEDSFIKDLYILAQGLINGFCNREFKEKEYQHELKGNGRQFLSVPVTPIKSIVELKINDILINNPKIKNNMLFNEKSFPNDYVSYHRDYSPNVYNKRYNIDVTYIAGYIYPEWEAILNTGDVPEELQYCLLEIMKGLYINSTTDRTLQSKEITAGAEKVKKTYFKGNLNPIPTYLEAILSKYKRGVE